MPSSGIVNIQPLNTYEIDTHAWETLNARIRDAAMRVGREASEVTLVGASKTVPAPVLQAFCTAGLRIVGENYLQEGIAKREALRDLPLTWHFIGGLQSNKARLALQFDLIHSVDRRSLIVALDKAAREVGRVQDVLLQVNLADEASKGGCRLTEVFSLAAALADSPHLRCCGLMCLPPYSPNAENTRPYFRQLRALRDALQREHPTCRALSMGMSNNFEVAIEEGATLVRIGTALFGARPTSAE